MASYDTGCPYYVFAPDGVNYVAFNVPTDPYFVGYITDVTGLDDGEVRESADVVPSGHGGRHHNFFQGRRPWTLSGIVMPVLPAAARAAAQDAMEGLMALCLNADGKLQWNMTDGIVRYLNFRKQLSVRMTKGQGQLDRRFQIAGVASDWRVLSGNKKSVAASGVNPTTPVMNNSGTADAAPDFTVNGPVTNPTITNIATGKRLEIDYILPAGSAIHATLSSKFPLVDVNGAANNGLVNLVTSDWTIAVVPNRYGYSNQFQLTGSGMTAATSLTVSWTDSWV